MCLFKRGKLKFEKFVPLSYFCGYNTSSHATNGKKFWQKKLNGFFAARKKRVAV